MDVVEFGERINKRRKELKMTQKELAHKLGVSDRAVSKWETGRGFPDISLMDALAAALDLEIADLFIGEKDEKEIGEKTMRDLVNDTLEYTKKVKITYSDKIKQIALVTISALCIIGILTVAIVNYAIERELTWGLVAIASTIFGWLILIPIVIKEKKGIKFSLIIISVGVIPLIYIISNSLGLDAHVMSIGWKASLFGIAYAWIAYFLFAIRKLEYYTITSILIILATVLSYGIELMLEYETGVVLNNTVQNVGYIANLIAATTIYIYFTQKRRR